MSASRRADALRESAEAAYAELAAAEAEAVSSSARICVSRPIGNGEAGELLGCNGGRLMALRAETGVDRRSWRAGEER